ncbi:ABC transporter permease [Mesorhizobium sp. M1E.F.Ca.ET.041.01.1.1]|uniref:ABC transporter permease n=1 Tax=Mesorhizobium sp. M1E.F.Ca.ET.041.01.1.1 TaxID=2496759 RepID=UPI000FCA153B|nr:ABC transporter permease [Mesorhizobium sp. M1E.F.Ca.ET.041.01.1.1]RUW36309.1 ABC transporter permease [Mesorhizobium sp. M1E.F.Ca.ET.041.01.1.1]
MTSQIASRRHLLLLGLPALAVVCLFVMLPYGEIVLMSFRTPSTTAAYGPGFTVDNYAKILSDPLYLKLLLDTLWQASISTIFCLILGFPVAFHLGRTQSRWRGLLYAMVLSPLLTGVVIRCFGWIVLLSNTGVVNELLSQFGLGPYKLMYNRIGVVIALVHVFLPFMILPIMNSVQNIDPRFEEAARTMGASKTSVFRHVLLPLTMPGIQSGAILVFALAASAYVIPILLGGGQVQTMTTVMVQQLTGSLLWPFGTAMALVLAAGMALTIIVFVFLMRQNMRSLK